MINFRPLTPHIVLKYTRKMAIVSWSMILWRHVTLRTAKEDKVYPAVD